MKNPLLLGTTLLLGIAIGLAVDRIRGGGSRDGEDAGKQSTRQPSGRAVARHGSGTDEVLADFLKGRSPSELTAEDVYQLMKPMIRDPMVSSVGNQMELARMRYQIELLASKLPVDVIEQTMDLARENATTPYMIRPWFGAFVSRDPERALDWATRQPDARDWRGTAIACLVGTNPELAEKLHEDELLTGSSSLTLQEIPARLAQVAAKQGSAAVFRLVDSMPKESTNTAIYRAWHVLPEEERPAFLAEISKRADAGDTSYQIYRTGLILARSDSHPEEMREWMEKQTPGARADMAMKLATRKFNSGNADAAKEYLATAMATTPGSKKEFVNDRVITFRNNPDLFTMMVEMLPPDQKPTLEDVRQWAGNSGPQGMLEVASFIASPDERASYVIEALDRLSQFEPRSMNAVEFQILSRRLQALDLTGEAADRANAALESTRKKVLEQ